VIDTSAHAWQLADGELARERERVVADAVARLSRPSLGGAASGPTFAAAAGGADAAEVRALLGRRPHGPHGDRAARPSAMAALRSAARRRATTAPRCADAAR
jgi:hypothetical protein